MKQTGRITKFSLWFLPTLNELFVYIFIVLLVYVISNIGFVEQTLEIQQSTLTVQNVVFSPVDWAFHRIGGETFARIVPQLLFWGFVGFLVYGLVLLSQNFLNEVLNDVNESNYIRPKNVSRWASAKESVEKFTVRFFVLVIGILYAIAFFRWVAPNTVEQFRITSQYKSLGELGNGFLVAFLFVMALHIFTIIARFLKLKRPNYY